MKITVLFIGVLAKRFDSSEIELNLPGEEAKVSDVLQMLCDHTEDEELSTLVYWRGQKNYNMVLNGRHAELDTIIRKDSMLAVLPFMTGG
jgi:molybdopterin converting factor small subunit